MTLTSCYLTFCDGGYADICSAFQDSASYCLHNVTSNVLELFNVTFSPNSGQCHHQRGNFYNGIGDLLILDTSCELECKMEKSEIVKCSNFIEEGNRALTNGNKLTSL